MEGSRLGAACLVRRLTTDGGSLLEGSRLGAACLVRRLATEGRNHSVRGGAVRRGARSAIETGGSNHGLRFFLAARHEHIAVLVVPRRNPVPPPQLAADAPVLDVLHPVAVGVDPVGRHEADIAALCEMQAACGQRVHLHEPLVGEIRLDRLSAAVATRHLQLVRFRLDQQTGGFEIGKHLLSSLVTIQPTIFGWNQLWAETVIWNQDAPIVDRIMFRQLVADISIAFWATNNFGVGGENIDDWQAVPLADDIVIEIMRRRDLHNTGAEFAVDIRIGDHRNLAPAQRQGHGLADQLRVAFVVRMHHHRGIAEHGLRPGGRDHDLAAAIGQRIGDRPQEAIFLLVDHFKIRDRGLEHRVPVDQSLPTVDQAFIEQAHEGVDHRLRGHRVHGEGAARPVAGGAEAAHLPFDGVAGLVFPLPDFFDEAVATERITRRAFAFGGKVARDHHLGGDAGVVAAHLPQRAIAAHAVVAHQRVLQGVLEGVAHVQGAGDVGRWQQDAVGGAVALRGEHAARFPRLVDAGFELLGFVAGV